MAERRMFGIGPHPPPVRHDDHHPPIILQQPPGFPQHPPRMIRLLQPVHDQNPVERHIRERQRIFLGLAGEVSAPRRPGEAAHLLGRDTDAARRLLAP